MGTVTVTVNHYDVDGRFQRRLGTITMSSSYATGGDTITAAQMGLDRVLNMDLDLGVNTSNTANAYAFVGPTSSFQSSKIQAFGDGGNAPGGALIEAGSGDNLSTVTLNFDAVGY